MGIRETLVMGLVVHLNERRRESRALAEPPAGGASIHLFLGVRYERHEEAPAQPKAPERSGGGGRRARKRA